MRPFSSHLIGTGNRQATWGGCKPQGPPTGSASISERFHNVLRHCQLLGPSVQTHDPMGDGYFMSSHNIPDTTSRSNGSQTNGRRSVNNNTIDIPRRKEESFSEILTVAVL